MFQLSRPHSVDRSANCYTMFNLSRLPSVNLVVNRILILILSRLLSVDMAGNRCITLYSADCHLKIDLQTCLSCFISAGCSQLVRASNLCIMFLLSRLSSVYRVSVVSWSMMLHLSRLFYVLMYHVCKG